MFHKFILSHIKIKICIAFIVVSKSWYGILLRATLQLDYRETQIQVYSQP